MFQEAYKRAYDNKVPKHDLVLEIEEHKRTKLESGCLRVILKSVVACMGVILVLGSVVTPVLACEFPFVYKIVEKYAPSLIDYILPQEYSCSKAGITMQVEAIHVNDKDAEVIVSFKDEQGYDYIDGKVDLYDSYHITSYSGDSNVGGCSFLEYDMIEDKAYYKLDMSSLDTFDKEKFRFRVNMLLTNCVSENIVIDLAEMDKLPVFKNVTLNGYGGSLSSAKMQEYFGKSDSEPWKKGAEVISSSFDNSMLDKLKITAIGYQDGILRIQNCRGTLTEADRHMNIMLRDTEGNERYCDCSVDWQEEISGEKVAFNEQWFLINETELEQVQAIAEMFVTDGCVKGNWEVVFMVDE